MNESSSQQQLYAPRTQIYPRSVSGRYRNLKWGVLILAYGVYFLLPWLRWEREAGANQAVLFDLAGRKFYLFDLVVHPQDIFWLAGLLMIAAYLLFFVTGLAGRVFCGYFCFQTLWTDVY
ncbi:MAG: (Fe-S)-binding protein, partial [Sedimenticolaceae bacterium]